MQKYFKKMKRGVNRVIFRNKFSQWYYYLLKVESDTEGWQIRSAMKSFLLKLKFTQSNGISSSVIIFETNLNVQHHLFYQKILISIS